MSNETKNKTAADTVAENVQAIAEATAAGAASAKEVATAAAEVAAVPTKSGKGKQAESKPKAERTNGKEATGALRAIGLAACLRHGLKCVWVTDDGQCFDQESNARAHGKNLGNSEPLKVEA
ncbi:MAG: hypothetical protein K2L55_09105 [Muribaculaceae bacterium]|nr:hypothetical protein [Muribaculaceae bacterium]